MFYLTLILAVLVSIGTTLFCVVSGAGFFLDLLGASSVLFLSLGCLLSSSDLKRGSTVSTIGVGAAGIVVLVGIAELVSAIPFRRQPGQASLLYVPFLFLVALALHLASIRGRLKDAEDAELMKALTAQSQ